MDSKILWSNMDKVLFGKKKSKIVSNEYNYSIFIFDLF